jgi:serine/threonine protein kinase
MWSLGVVLFALVCGFLPFVHDNRSELYKKILKGDYECRPLATPQVKDLLSKILNTNPKQRYSIAQARKHPWMQMVKVKNVQHAAPAIRRGPNMTTITPLWRRSHKRSSLATRRTARGAAKGSPTSPVNADIDQQVLRQCADLGFKSAQVVEGLVNKLENQETQAYRLLCSRKVKIASAQKKVSCYNLQRLDLLRRLQRLMDN